MGFNEAHVTVRWQPQEDRGDFPLLRKRLVLSFPFLSFPFLSFPQGFPSTVSVWRVISKVCCTAASFSLHSPSMWNHEIMQAYVQQAWRSRLLYKCRMCGKRAAQNSINILLIYCQLSQLQMKACGSQCDYWSHTKSDLVQCAHWHC